MKFELPFSADTVPSMLCRTLVISENHHGDAMFREVRRVDVKSGGDIDQGYFEVVNGVLRLVDRQGLYAEFFGLESRNGVIFATGKLAQTISKDGRNRVVLHERVSLTEKNFGICVSSHVSYEKSTLPVLLDSIRKSGFDMARVVVVVGGYKGAKTAEIEVAKVVYQEANGQGFGGLMAVTGNYPYWLMIHDTCEAERSFVSSVGDVDIGLCPDVIRLRTDKEDWTGFYRTKFVQEIKKEIEAKPELAESVIKQLAQVVSVVPGRVVEAGVKDVYGTGNRRVVEKMPVGIRKYRGATKRRTP